MLQIKIEQVSDKSTDHYKVDVVFIHGLEGCLNTSWTAKSGAFWPNWIAEDFPDARVSLLGYPSTFFNDPLDKKAANLDIYSRAKAIIDYLINSGFGNKPTIFICHSLGGVLLQEILRQSHDGLISEWKNLKANTVGVVLLGVPNSGAVLAKCLSSFLPASKLLKDLSNDNGYLKQLGTYFRTFVNDNSCKVRAYSEGKATKGVMLVDSVSADPHIAQCPIIPTDDDHITIAKPTSKGAPVYMGVSTLIRQVGGEVPCADEGINALEQSLIQERMDDFSRKVGRDSLLTKLRKGGREYAGESALRKKKKFAELMASNTLTNSGRSFYTELCGDVRTRFDMAIVPLIHKGLPPEEINQEIRNQVIDPIMKKYGDKKIPIQEALIDEALYFLTGNCHIKWHTND